MRYLIFISFFIAFFHTAIANAFTLTSPAFQNENKIPTVYTCDGTDYSPPDLYWTDPPLNTKSFALIVEDPDAPGGTWVHWVIFNIPSNIKELTAKTSALINATQGNNSWNQTGYRGPCPPSGEHRYFFTLYALDTQLDSPTNTNAAQLQTTIKQHILGKAILMGKYSRNN